MPIMTRFSRGRDGHIVLDQLVALPVDEEEDLARWNRLVTKHHYLRSATLCGPQIRYVVSCRGRAVALLSFSAASWHLRDRDRWIGWNEKQRLSRLGFVAQNSRFLILPGISTRNLASKSLSLCLARLKADWLERYQQPLLLVETFVEKSYPGTSYRADNWTRLGETRGFSRDGAEFYRLNEAPKTLWVKELHPQARTWLAAPQLPPQYQPFERDIRADEHARLATAKSLESLYEVFQAVPDPRHRSGRRHSLPCCLAIIASGFLLGCEGLAECADYGRCLKPAQLRAIRARRNRRTKAYEAPCHETLWRVMSRIDTGEFERLIGEWYNGQQEQKPKAYALDGKTLCGSLDEKGNALHVVSVVSHDRTPFFCKRRPTTRATKAKPRATSSCTCRSSPAACSRPTRCIFRKRPSASSWRTSTATCSSASRATAKPC
jgi:hypothetical protein